MSGRQPEEDVRIAAMTQGWRDVLFLHWPCAPEVIERLLPEPFQPDLHDGQAWVSVVAFDVHAARGLGVVPLGRGSFPETNLRTYVVGPDGRDGIFFLTLEVANVPSLVGGRAAGTAYRPARMAVERADGCITYASRRWGTEDVGHRLTVRPGGSIDPTPLDHWLTGRWRAWSLVVDRPVTVAVHHRPWDLHEVEVVSCEETLRVAHGVPEELGAPLAHWSPGVDVRLSPPRFLDAPTIGWPHRR